MESLLIYKISPDPSLLKRGTKLVLDIFVIPLWKMGSICVAVFSPCGRETVPAHSSYGFLQPLPLALETRRNRSEFADLRQQSSGGSKGDGPLLQRHLKDFDLTVLIPPPPWAIKGEKGRCLCQGRRQGAKRALEGGKRSFL